jgi:26S proteasome regulatory subunit N3
MVKKQENGKNKLEEDKKPEIKIVPEIKLSPRQLFSKDLGDSILMVVTGVEKRDRRLMTRAVGRLTSLRKRLLLEQLRESLTTHFSEGHAFLERLQDAIPMDTNMDSAPVIQDAVLPEVKLSEEEKRLRTLAIDLHEVKLFLHLFVALVVSDHGRQEDAVNCVNSLVIRLHSQNRRTADLLSAKIYHYYSLFHERVGRLLDIRNDLLSFHRSACLAHNEPGQATLATCILRNFLSCNLINQADNFRMKISFPENSSNNVLARWLYYLGRIESVQLRYSDAYANLIQVL